MTSLKVVIALLILILCVYCTAATAITQKSEETSITYMNRGQSYAIQLNDRHKHEGPITSTVAITFHDPSHRRVANNYWKFWLSQQKTPQAARAIDIGKMTHMIDKIISFTHYLVATQTTHNLQGSAIFSIQVLIASLSSGMVHVVHVSMYDSIACQPTFLVSKVSRVFLFVHKWKVVHCHHHQLLLQLPLSNNNNNNQHGNTMNRLFVKSNSFVIRYNHVIISLCIIGY